MEERRNFNTSKAPRMSQAFPQAVITEKFIFVSGTPGLDLNTGQVVSDSFEDQTRQCFHNIKVILEEGGSSMTNVVKTTIFLTDMALFTSVNEVYGKYFNGEFPARETVAVRGLPKNVNVEISMIAVVS